MISEALESDLSDFELLRSLESVWFDFGQNFVIRALDVDSVSSINSKIFILGY